jgi:hypothetical protein
MARSDAYKSTAESPVKKYLSWSSNDKCFTYYDRETKERNKKIAIPLKFIHIDELATIKGFHEPTQSGIYSNEVRSTKKEILTVKYKAGDLAKGLYQDIKLKVNDAGADYHASIYILLNGELVNLAIRGSVIAAWSAFTKDNRKNFLGSYVEVAGSVDEKKGAVKYSVPVFKAGGAIEVSVSEKAEEAYDALQVYFKNRKDEQTEQPEYSRSEEIEHPSMPKFAPEPVFDTAKEDNPLPF